MSKKAYVVFDMLMHERLEEFCRRLLDAPGCSSMGEAFKLLADTMIAVEDEFPGIAFDPDYPRHDGRMYPPKEDAHRNVQGGALTCIASAAVNTTPTSAKAAPFLLLT